MDGSMNMRYKNIVLDVGNVLLSYRWQEMMEDYGLSPAESLRFYNMMFEDPLWLEFDLENIPYGEVVERFVQKNPSHEDAIRYFLSHIERMPVARPQVYARIERLLDSGIKAYILSNYSSVLFAEHTKLIPFMDRLSGMVVSSSVHIIKPNRAIYEALFEKCGILPQESLFFDDRRENTEAAIAAGMDAICVRTEEELIAALEKLLID